MSCPNPSNSRVLTASPSSIPPHCFSLPQEKTRCCSQRTHHSATISCHGLANQYSTPNPPHLSSSINFDMACICRYGWCSEGTATPLALSLTMLDVSSCPLLTSYSVLDRSISLKATDLFFGTSARRTMRVALCLLQLTQMWLACQKKNQIQTSL